MTSTDFVPGLPDPLPPSRDPDTVAFELDQRRAAAYAKSGYWPDAGDIAQALVKIEAGRSIGLPPLIAMSEVHVIKGKPTLGAGAQAALVKASGRYDYRVVAHDNEKCVIRFYEIANGEVIGESQFTLKDAEKAKLLTNVSWQTYPRNMLFARAMTNGVAWFCPDVTLGRVYDPEELGADDTAWADYGPEVVSTLDQEYDDEQETLKELLEMEGDEEAAAPGEPEPKPAK
jgi:hypothetical protein